MEVTLGEMDRVVNDGQLENVYGAMVVIKEGIKTVLRPVLENAEVPMVTTLSGISAVVSELIPLNALAPIFVKVVGITTDVK